jgi:hypothetical protein
MISKGFITNMFVILALFFSCCPCAISKIDNKPIKDINGLIIINKVNKDKVTYVRENGERIGVNKRGLEFNGGDDALKTYLDSVFYNNPDYQKHSEFNVLENFIILFDKDLDIKEVCIMYRDYSNNTRFYYDSIFVDALKNTTGMWHKTVKDKEWYIYLHRQRIY